MSIRVIAFLGMVLGAVALGVALGSQIFLGLVPCALCYAERWPYRAAISLGLLGLLVPPRFARVFCWLVVAAYTTAAAAAFVHVGVEQHWWKSPLPECTAPDLRGLTNAQMLARMPDRPVKSCEDADYLIPGIPITFAQANLLYALVVGGMLTTFLIRGPKRSVAPALF
jgi:disulfide bond formation protein DsbB